MSENIKIEREIDLELTVKETKNKLIKGMKLLKFDIIDSTHSNGDYYIEALAGYTKLESRLKGLRKHTIDKVPTRLKINLLKNDNHTQITIHAEDNVGWYIGKNIWTDAYKRGMNMIIDSLEEILKL